MSAMTIPALLEQQNQMHPDHPAILAPERAPLSYAGLWARVQELVAALNELGIGRQDRVALVLPNGPEMAVAFLATASCATSAPLNPGYRAPEFEFYLSDLAARAVIVAAELYSPVRDVARQLNIPIIELALEGSTAGSFSLSGPSAGQPGRRGLAGAEDVALVLHTSGTTSRPKIVPLTQGNILQSARNIRATLQLTAADRCLNVMVLFHIHGLMAALMASLVAGGSIVCTPGFLAPRFFGWLAAFQPSWYTAVPTMHQAILGRAAENQVLLAQIKLRFVRSSSASLPPSVMAALEKTFQAPVIEAYGMTEASHQMTSNPLPPEPRKAGTVGRAAGPEVAIMHESDSTLLSRGERGEIVIRGANVTLGYANNEEANAKAFTAGWFRTGDQGFFDAGGYLTISGRLKEIINRGGEKILPREIDEVLLTHPAVVQAVAFGIENPLLGEEIGAAVILNDPQVTAQALRRYVAGQLASFKVPYQIVIVDAIPKGPTGKLQRIGMAERMGLQAAEMGTAADVTPYAAPQNEIERQLAAIWCTVLNLDQVGVTQPFLDSGGDSMTAAQLIVRIQEGLGLRLSVVDLFDAPTVREQALVIERLLAAEDTAAADTGSLRLIQNGNGERPSLFLLPGGGGGEEEFLIYSRLIHLLGAEQTVYGFFARGQDEAEDEEAHASVRGMVDDYLQALRQVQAVGPYFLAGECVGGKVAYEMACRLDGQGETAVLLLLNTQMGAGSQGRPPGSYWLGRAKYHWQQWQKRSGEERMRYLRETLQASPLNPAAARSENYKTDRRILRARVMYNEMLQDHVPEAAYERPVMLIVSEDHYARTPAMGLEPWASGGLEIYPVQGDLDSYLGAHVQTTAQQVRDCLQAASARIDEAGGRQDDV